jgi:hypothetical protein
MSFGLVNVVNQVTTVLSLVLCNRGPFSSWLGAHEKVFVIFPFLGMSESKLRYLDYRDHVGRRED